MRVVEQPRAESARSEDPIDAVAALAREAGAPAIDRDAKALVARLHRARTFIAVLADDGALLVNTLAGEGVLPLGIQSVEGIPVLVRYGRVRRARIVLRDGGRRDIPLTHLDRFISTSGNFGNHRGVAAVEITTPTRALIEGLCLVVGMSAEVVAPLDLVPRLDAAIVQTRDGTRPDLEVERFIEIARIPAAEVSWVSTPLADLDLANILARMVSRLDARSVEGLHDQEIRRLHFRLQLHLHDQRRALECNEREIQHTLDAVDACMILAAHLLEDRARRPDEDRELLQRTLATERTKFLMSSKADAVAAFGARFDATSASRSGLHTAAVLISSAIASEEILAWRPVTRDIVNAAVIAMGNRLLHRARASFGPLMDWVPALALLNVAVIPVRRPLQMRLPPAPAAIARLGDRLRFAAGARRRAEQHGVDALLWSLDKTSQEVIADHLCFYDAATEDIAASLTALLDQLAETVRASATQAREAQQEGEAALGLARARIDQWIVQLGELMARL